MHGLARMLVCIHGMAIGTCAYLHAWLDVRACLHAWLDVCACLHADASGDPSVKPKSTEGLAGKAYEDEFEFEKQRIKVCRLNSTSLHIGNLG